MMELTDAQKKVILIFKTNGSMLSEDKTKELKLDRRVINKLLTKDVLRQQDDKIMLVEYGKTPTQRKNSKRRTKSRNCLCGCDETTRGGRFMPGHDGRIRKKVMVFIKTGDCTFDRKNPEVMDYLKDAHWMDQSMWKEISQ